MKFNVKTDYFIMHLTPFSGDGNGWMAVGMAEMLRMMPKIILINQNSKAYLSMMEPSSLSGVRRHVETTD